MRSLRYVLGSKPNNLDDCLDMSYKQHPSEVILDLTSVKLTCI